MITEDQLEQECIRWFTDQGYLYKNGYDIAPDGDSPERDDYHQVVLKQRLLNQLEIINPELPIEALNDVVNTVSSPDTPILIKNNRAFHKFVIEGVPVEYTAVEDGESKTKHTHAQLMDFTTPDNNEFLIVNQFTITGTKGNRRPDVVVFINGLPISVIELKNPADEHADIWNAFNQLQTYKDEISDLFVFNEALIVSDGWTARVGSLTANKERFLPWKTVATEDDRPLLEFQLETMVRGFFKQDLLLDYIRYFVLFETDNDKIIKKIAGYHQFHAVRAAVEATVRAANTSGNFLESTIPALEKIKQGSGKAGVVWHTQGSGKSISMVCYASKLLQQASMNNPTIVVVTDRNDLDGQLYNTFGMAQETLKQIPQQADDRDALRELLLNRQSGGIIFTTIQKFALLDEETEHPRLSERSNIVVVSDEAHRSQYGNKSKMVEVKDKNGTVTGHKYVYGYSKYMRDALPNASFIGFTGTPIAMDDKDTRGVFGEYVSIYDIQDAVDDGATVPIYYESRLAKLDINQDEIEQLNDKVEDEIGEDEETADREKVKSEWATLEKLVGAEPRIEQVAKDLVEHFTTRTSTFPGKAMIVSMSREICVDLYNAIVAIKPEWYHPDTDKGAIKIVMTGSASDKEKMQPHIHDKKTKKLFEKRYKDTDDELQLVIVRDMWLTGFDAPCCHTMYIDKPMKGHNLMQAIARVNRVFKDKPGGLVVDYIGIANELKNALKTYTNSQGKGQPTVDTAEAFSVLMEKVDIIRGMFATPVDTKVFNYRPDFETDALRLLPGAVNHLSGLSHTDANGKQVRDGKRRFLDVMAALTKAYSLCNTMDETQGYKNEIAFYSAIKTAFIKHSTVDKKRTDEERNTALKQILNNAVIADGVDDIFSMVGLDKPNIGLLSEEFLEDVKNMKEKNLAVELLEKLLRDEVKSRMKNDVVQEKKYSERIMSTLQKYHNRSIETAQVIEELIQWAKEMQEDGELLDKLNLSVDEIAFYRALVDNESSVRELGDDNLRKLAIELTHQLRKSATVDWQKRDSVRARMRNLVRRLLRRWKYPPDAAEEAIKLVLEQAEVLADGWYAA
ncbi:MULTISPECIES: type I restriction endonuclease subunit R [Vibrio]|uniref:Type I restriction enzyme endonuclease subunit n=1 Tax=Vibrio crassostreae TaxID=246167 RepID=A0A822MS49_9VIBR|nr:type I restriction endonuclease subunit R [Vibrio crassostreae]MDH5952619.1 type I restriction endonuclease subunit R [Vibrio crassostreae]TCN04632.1 type I restriction enzyme R subunit [Vibrio crassostreae]TCN97884.1 type I restriction enzyme R subunit [Vibrio crassostreae]TCU06788.1 type I restriction enzyme R subunit [Vibrio crassostreae]CAK2375364.1 Type I restriction enzyme HindI endonuclease subunit [Vibrio crassostreae]